MSSDAKNEYNIFYHKLDAKYFHIKQFFRKQQYFLRKLQKTVLGHICHLFLEKGGVLRKKLIQPFLSRINYRIFYY